MGASVVLMYFIQAPKETFLLLVSGCCSCTQVCYFNSAKLFAGMPRTMYVRILWICTSETRAVKILCRRLWGFKKQFAWLLRADWEPKLDWMNTATKQLQYLAPMHAISLPLGLIQCRSQGCRQGFMVGVYEAKSICTLCIFSVFRFSFLPARGYCKQLQMSFLAAGCGQHG